MSFKGEPKVILMLSKDIDQPSVVGSQCVCDIIESLLHILHVVLEWSNHWIIDDTSARKLLFHFVQKRFKN